VPGLHEQSRYGVGALQSLSRHPEAHELGEFDEPVLLGLQFRSSIDEPVLEGREDTRYPAGAVDGDEKVAAANGLCRAREREFVRR